MNKLMSSSNYNLNIEECSEIMKFEIIENLFEN